MCLMWKHLRFQHTLQFVRKQHQGHYNARSKCAKNQKELNVVYAATILSSLLLYCSKCHCQKNFTKFLQDISQADLCVIGTSLAVAIANSLVFTRPKTAMRVVCNQEYIGSQLEIDYRDGAQQDFFAMGNSNAVFVDLMQTLGWLNNLAYLLESNDLMETSPCRLKN